MDTEKYLIKYVVGVIVLFLMLFLSTVVFTSWANVVEVFNSGEISLENIIDKNDNYVLDVKYPRFNKEEINNIILDYLYDYIRTFKENAKSKDKNKLLIEYEIYAEEDLLNVIFYINNTLNEKDKYKSFLIDVNKGKEISITEIYDSSYLIENINNKIKTKYSEYIVNVVNSKTLSDFDYKLTSEGINIYFNNFLFDKTYSYTPFVYISFKENAIVKERIIDTSKKIIAFTFDDGPGGYTKELTDILNEYSSSATFFMLGNRMKYNQDSVKYAYNNGMEIGSHTYAHKYLINLSDKEVLEEINSTTIIFNEITGSNIKLIRPPYGNYSNRVKELSPFPIILWNIDPKDWLYRDADKVYNHVLENISDGDIVLMHEVYPETVEAVKMLLPELKARGYEIVNVTELASIKNVELKKGNLYREFK